MNKKEIIKILDEYELSLDTTYFENSESYKVICDSVHVNEICFREVNQIKFCDETLWIDNASIEVKDVKEFEIHIAKVKYVLMSKYKQKIVMNLN